MLFCARPRGLERTEAEMQVAQNMDPHHCGPCVSRLAAILPFLRQAGLPTKPHADPDRLREQIGCMVTKGIPVVAAILGSDELAAGRVAVCDLHMWRQAAEHRPLRITSYAHELARAIAQLHRPCPIPGQTPPLSRRLGLELLARDPLPCAPTGTLGPASKTDLYSRMAHRRAGSLLKTTGAQRAKPPRSS